MLSHNINLVGNKILLINSHIFTGPKILRIL